MTDETQNESEEVQADDATVKDEASPAAEQVPTTEESTPDLAALEATVAELQDQLLRGQAELENFRRRSSRESMESLKYQSLPVVRDLLPVMDNLHRAIQAAEQTGDVGNLLEGIRMVSGQLSETLKSHAAQPIAAEGEAFDPNLHEALSQVPTPEHPPMTVIQVVETGYKMHDRVVRPAKVIVSCTPPEPAAETSADDQE